MYASCTATYTAYFRLYSVLLKIVRISPVACMVIASSEIKGALLFCRLELHFEGRNSNRFKNSFVNITTSRYNEFYCKWQIIFANSYKKIFFLLIFVRLHHMIYSCFRKIVTACSIFQLRSSNLVY
jgi:hypothetical protein